MQSLAHPRDIMNEVLKALHELNVCWKKVGHYNMKCKWVHRIQDSGTMHNDIGMMNNTVQESSGVEYSNCVKFEVQVIVLPHHF